MEPCVSCNSNDISVVTHDGFFYINAKQYSIKTKYLKCNSCNTEYMGKKQIEDNKKYLDDIYEQ
jgi:hypothetical protein